MVSQSVPTVQQTHQCVAANRSPITPTQTDQPNRKVSSKRPERTDQPVASAYQTHDPDSNPRAPRMVSQNRPKGSASPRAHVVSQTQRPWCRRCVARSTGAPQSLLECAAPGRSSQCGTPVTTKQLRSSDLQTSELRECIQLLSTTRLRLEHVRYPCELLKLLHKTLYGSLRNGHHSEAKLLLATCGVTKVAKLFSTFTRSAYPASSNVVNSVTSAFAFSRALLNCAVWAPDTPTCPLQRGLRARTVDSGGFSGLTANPQYKFGPSWSVRHLAAPLDS